MTNARDAILDRVRAVTRRNADSAGSQAAVRARLAAHARGPIPAAGQYLDQVFMDKARATSATVEAIPSIRAAGDAISRYFMEYGLEDRITVAPAPELQAIHWPSEIVHETRTAQAQDASAVTLAYAGIAETGSLALLSRPETPVLLNFLPDNHICLLQTRDIVAQMEDVWDRLRGEQRSMPRMLNFITGPSRTADVEQTIQLGAHGPRRLHILIIEE